jgi:hypothetical protein
MAVKFLLDTNVVIYLLGGRLKQALPSSTDASQTNSASILWKRKQTR